MVPPLCTTVDTVGNILHLLRLVLARRLLFRDYDSRDRKDVLATEDAHRQRQLHRQVRTRFRVSFLRLRLRLRSAIAFAQVGFRLWWLRFFLVYLRRIVRAPVKLQEVYLGRDNSFVCPRTGHALNLAFSCSQLSLPTLGSRCPFFSVIPPCLFRLTLKRRSWKRTTVP